MDNSLVHISINKFLNALCKITFVDCMVFMAKTGWSAFYIVEGVRRNYETKYSSELHLIVGIFLFTFCILRYIANIIAFKNTSYTLEKGEEKVRIFFCTRWFGLVKAWVIIAALNIGGCLATMASWTRLSIGPAILFLVWEVVTLVIVTFLRFIVYRHYSQRGSNSNILPTTL